MAVRTSFTSGEVLTAADLTDTFGSKLNLAGGKILQIVRATDSTNRSTTSTSFVDASISVTITPQKNNSAILLIWNFHGLHVITSDYAFFTITDNSNNSLSGAQKGLVGSNTTSEVQATLTVIGYSTPATTNATTYKGRFCVNLSGSAQLINANSTGQLYAIEVSA